MKSAKLCGVSPAGALLGELETGRVLELDRWLLRSFLRGVGSPDIGAALWDGQELLDPLAPFRLVVRSRGALLRLLANPL